MEPSAFATAAGAGTVTVAVCYVLRRLWAPLAAPVVTLLTAESVVWCGALLSSPPTWQRVPVWLLTGLVVAAFAMDILGRSGDRRGGEGIGP